MKISDVTFKTRMTKGSENIDETLTFIGSGSIDAVDHAVLQHDALVAMNAELVEALGGLLKTDYMSIEEKDKYRVVVAKARELSQ